MKITYRIDQSLGLICSDIGISIDEAKAAIRSGLDTYTHWWDHSIEESSKGKYIFRVVNQTSPTRWAWQSGNTINLNRFVLNNGVFIPWNTGGLKFVGMHETGHALLTRSHITNPPWYNDISYGHVLAITSYWYQGSFSPLEVAYGVTKNKWVLKPNGQHPFTPIYLSDKVRHYDAMVKICTPYAQYGLYRPIGDPTIDKLMAAVPKIAIPKVTFKR